jgi:hypothetical protein
MVLLFQTEWCAWRSQPQRGSRTQTVPRPSRPARLDRCTTASASWSGIIAAPAVSIMPAAPGETTRPTIDRYGCKRAAETRARATHLPSGIAPRVADYEDASALKRALAGIDDMVLISSDGDASAVMRHHADAIEAATATNIRHITFTSIVDTGELSPFYFSPVYRDAERQLVDKIIRLIPTAGRISADLGVSSAEAIVRVVPPSSLAPRLAFGCS